METPFPWALISIAIAGILLLLLVLTSQALAGRRRRDKLSNNLSIACHATYRLRLSHLAAGSGVVADTPVLLHDRPSCRVSVRSLYGHGPSL